MSSAYFMSPPSENVVASTTNGSAEFRHPPEESQCAVLVEPLVQVAALGALDAGWAAVRARAALEQLDGVRDPAFEALEAARRDADAAGVAVVDEDRRAARLVMDVRREAADVPAVAHRPEREQRNHRVLRGVQAREQLRHGLESVELRGLRQVPHGLRIEVRLRELERDRVERRAVARLLLVGDPLLAGSDAAEAEA